MHGWIILVLIALASNLDNGGVGISYGLRHIRVPWAQNLMVAVAGGAATGAAMLGGRYIGTILHPDVASWFGASVIGAIGIWVIGPWRLWSHTSPTRRGRGVSALLRHPEWADQDRSGEISWTEAALLAPALSINNLANGFSAGLFSLNTTMEVLLTVLFGYLVVDLGQRLAERHLSRAVGEAATLLAGGLLVVVAFLQVVKI